MNTNDGAPRGLAAIVHYATPWELVEMLVLFVFMVAISSTLSLSELIQKIKRPRSLMIGLIAQFVLLPPLGFVTAKVFHLRFEHTVGLIVVCCCPGGTASNIMCHMFRADVALSITLTAVSSIVAFVALPANLAIYLGKVELEETLELHAWDLSKLTLVIVIGTATGIALERHGSTKVLRVVQAMGSASTVFLLTKSLISSAHSQIPIWQIEPDVIAALMVPIVGGHTFGQLSSRFLGIKRASGVAIALEISIQNKFLALGLVGLVFSGDEGKGSIARAIPLLYGTLSMTFNVLLIILYWKIGWTQLSPQSPWWAPFQTLSMRKRSSAEVVVEVAKGPPLGHQDALEDHEQTGEAVECVSPGQSSPAVSLESPSGVQVSLAMVVPMADTNESTPPFHK